MRKLIVLAALCMGLYLGYLWLLKQDELPEYEHWYQMTWKGQDVGYMHQQALIQGQYYEITTETRVKTANQGVDFSFNERHVLRFNLSEKQDLLSSYYRLESPHHFSEARLHQNQYGYRTWQQINNKESKSQLENSFTLTDYLGLQNWLREEPQVGSSHWFTSLQPEKLEFSSIQYHIDAIDGDMTTVRSNTSNDSNSKTMVIDAAGFVKTYAYSDIISLTRVQDKTELTVSNSEDYYATQMVPIDKPLGDPMQWQTLTIKASSPELMAQISASRRQHINADEVTLSADISASAQNDSDDNYYELPEDLDLKQRLRKMAMDVTIDYVTPIEQITALREFVASYIADVPRIQSLDIAEILALPEGDCTEHAALFNALVTSLGYSAKTVNGLVYLGDNFQGFGGHQWSEVLLDGHWVGFDPTWNINSLSATHIRFNQELSDDFFNRVEDNYQFTLLLSE